MLWERCSPDSPAKGPWPQALRARALIVWPAAAPRARFTTSLDGLAGVYVAYCRTVDVTITSSLTLVVDDASGVLMRIGSLVYQWLARSRRQVGPWHDRHTLSQA